jgi:hypothetical protein
MKLFRGKRGNVELVIGPLFPLLLVVAVFILLLVYISVVSQSSYFEREFLTRDIGLMVEALEAAPHNVQINYPSENGDKAKKLMITINNKSVEAHDYNLDPKIVPSKVSKFVLFPSNMQVKEFVASPRVEKDTNGKNITFTYRLYFLKDANGITPSMNQVGIPTQINENSYKGLIDTAIEKWYQTPKVYLDLMYLDAGEKTGDGNTGDVLLKNICNVLLAGVGKGIYTLNECDNNKLLTQTLDERKEKAKNADFIVFLYLNDKKQDYSTITIYTLNNGGDSTTKSEKLGGLASIALASMNYNVDKKAFDEQRFSDALEIASSKPGIIVEIGNLKGLNKEDDKIGDGIRKAIDQYYSN